MALIGVIVVPVAMEWRVSPSPQFHEMSSATDSFKVWEDAISIELDSPALVVDGKTGEARYEHGRRR